MSRYAKVIIIAGIFGLTKEKKLVYSIKIKEKVIKLREEKYGLSIT